MSAIPGLAALAGSIWLQLKLTVAVVLATSGTQVLPAFGAGADLIACSVTLAAVIETWSGTVSARPVSLNTMSHEVLAVPEAPTQVVGLGAPLADSVAVPAVLRLTLAALLLPPVMVNSAPPGCKVVLMLLLYSVEQSALLQAVTVTVCGWQVRALPLWVIWKWWALAGAAAAQVGL